MSLFSKLPATAEIIEVGPRDGLQNETTVLSLDTKSKFIEMLALSGIKNIETTSFVRGDRIPQMSDSSELYKKVSGLGVNLPCLVPNMKGLENAIDAGVKTIAVFTATSDTFNKKNINATVEESLERISDVLNEALKNGMKVRGYVSTAFGCPYEGVTSADKLAEVSRILLELGCYEVSIGDTIGVATPNQVEVVVNRLKKDLDLSNVSMHFHDTRGMAIANIVTSLALGINRFDSSAGGLGGCPYAKGATGNVATEDLVYLMDSMGIETGIDMEKLAEASSFILGELNKGTSSKFLRAYLATKNKKIDSCI